MDGRDVGQPVGFHLPVGQPAVLRQHVLQQGAIGRVDRVDVAGGHAPGGSRWRGLAEIHRLHPILGRGVDPGHVFERQLIEALGGGADPGRDIAVGGQQRAHPMPDKVGVPLGLAQTRRPLLA
ncbi:Uncharacterised protein [Mycobacterium tuberculosis]|uniref:Uncharacterized protein n=1 Tax=Mycobacterium tuberculosis TaxID=1773 RepID=A0A654TP24_MYCTX|nr:Uncharacterised protein [Mycobacterium tuberculosis]